MSARLQSEDTALHLPSQIELLFLSRACSLIWKKWRGILFNSANTEKQKYLRWNNSAALKIILIRHSDAVLFKQRIKSAGCAGAICTHCLWITLIWDDHSFYSFQCLFLYWIILKSNSFQIIHHQFIRKIPSLSFSREGFRGTEAVSASVWWPSSQPGPPTCHKCPPWHQEHSSGPTLNQESFSWAGSPGTEYCCHLPVGLLRRHQVGSLSPRREPGCQLCLRVPQAPSSGGAAESIKHGSSPKLFISGESLLYAKKKGRRNK